MERYLDLKEYIRVLAKYRLFIIGVLLVTALITTFQSFQERPEYEASALVDVTKPIVQLNFDPRLNIIPPQVPTSGMDTILKSPDVVVGVAQDVGLPATGDQSDLVNELGRMVKIESLGGDLYTIQVRAEDPKTAAKMADSWATRFAKQMNEVFAPSTAPINLIQSQLQDTDKELKRAEAAYVDFQQTSQITLLNKQLDAKTSNLAAYINTHEGGQPTVLSKEIASETSALSADLAAGNRIRLVLQDAQNLKDQLTANSSGPSGASSSIASLLLEMNSLNSGSNLPVQLQIPLDAGNLGSGTPAQQALALDGLISTLKAKEKTASDEVDRLSAQIIKLDGLGFDSTSPSENDPVAKEISATAAEILTLKGQIAQQQVESDRLDLARSTERSTYQTLSTKLDEARIAAAASGPVRVVTQAVEPRLPVSSNGRSSKILAGALLGLFVGVVGSFLWEYVFRHNFVPVPAAVRGENAGEL